jgi:hypothetical protein
MTAKSLICCYAMISSIESWGESIIDNSYASFIGGGKSNCIDISANYPGENLITGGANNRICCQSSCSGIVGGDYNKICNSNGSFMGGGSQKNISGSFSAILGGSGNNDGGFAYSGIFGQGVTAVAANTFHVERIYANGIPNVGGAGPTGTFAWKAGNLISAADKVLVWI